MNCSNKVMKWPNASGMSQRRWHKGAFGMKGSHFQIFPSGILGKMSAGSENWKVRFLVLSGIRHAPMEILRSDL